MIVNLLEIKQLVDRIIEKLKDDIESSGMEGDFGYVEVLENQISTLNKVKEELEGYRNTNLSIPFMFYSLQQATPTLDLNYLIQEFQGLIRRKEYELEMLQQTISKEKELLTKLEASLVDPQVLPSIN